MSLLWCDIFAINSLTSDSWVKFDSVFLEALAVLSISQNDGSNSWGTGEVLETRGILCTTESVWCWFPPQRFWSQCSMGEGSISDRVCVSGYLFCLLWTILFVPLHAIKKLTSSWLLLRGKNQNNSENRFSKFLNIPASWRLKEHSSLFTTLQHRFFWPEFSPLT